MKKYLTLLGAIVLVQILILSTVTRRKIALVMKGGNRDTIQIRCWAKPHLTAKDGVTYLYGIPNVSSYTVLK